jgi:uncharacterized LabA/DUF88 family protein
MKTNIYVDGFNLYYGVLKSTPYRWLNIEELCRNEFPANTINRIRYFTARVKARPGDPQQPIRQATYLRALKTLPNLTVHYGHYLESEVRMPLASPPTAGPRTVLVRKSEEKGSDVNIASYLLVDTFDQDCEAAIIISNDSDLEEPIRLVRQKFGIRVVALLPCRANTTPGAKVASPSVQLRKVASYSKVITPAFQASSQFPGTLTDAVGAFTKPAAW